MIAMRRLSIFPCLLVCLALACTSAAAASDRVALVIGNAEYATPELQLRNPVSDAVSISRELARLGFDVSTLLDSELEGMRSALAQFGERMRGAEIAIIYFAGHGIQMEGENHLVAVDVQASTAEGFADAAVTLSEIQRLFHAAGPSLGVIVLDACRNNAFADAGAAPSGLAPTRGGAGLLVAYSTDPGNVALDGRGAHSPFAAALLDNLGTPGLDVRLMLGRVRQQVLIDTRGRQVPWVEESVLGQHFLNPDPLVRPLEGVMTRDVQTWRAINTAPSQQAYLNYLALFPEGLFADLARQYLSGQAHTGSVQQVDSGDLAQVASAADPERLAAALEILGFGDGAVTPNALQDGIGRYAAHLAGAPTPDAAQIYASAAHRLLKLGTNAAQRLRTDLVSLTSVDRALALAENARRELRILAPSDPAAQTALVRAESDLTAIKGARARIMSRLDETRGFYADLLSAGRGFEGELMRAAEHDSPDTKVSSTAANSIVDDTRTFVAHVVAAGLIENRGSYGWLRDFLPEA